MRSSSSRCHNKPQGPSLLRIHAGSGSPSHQRPMPSRGSATASANGLGQDLSAALVRRGGNRSTCNLRLLAGCVQVVVGATFEIPACSVLGAALPAGTGFVSISSLAPATRIHDRSTSNSDVNRMVLRLSDVIAQWVNPNRTSDGRHIRALPLSFLLRKTRLARKFESR